MRLCTKWGDKSDNNVGYKNGERGWERERERAREMGGGGERKMDTLSL